MNFKPVILATAVASASLVHADANNAYITLGAGYSDNSVYDEYETTTGSDIRDSWTSEISLGYHFLPSLAAEASVTLPGLLQDDDRPEINQYQIKGLYFFGDNAVKPYLTAGYGIEQINVPQDGAKDETTHVYSYGAGLQYDFDETVFARAEYHIDEMTDESNEHGVAMLEVGFRFGTESSKPAAKPLPVATKPVVAPAPAKVVEVKPEPVVETKPAPVVKPVPVIVEVQPVDTDQDGVEDKLDNCPDTIQGATVNAEGCAAFEGKLDGVKFESGSANLTPNARTILDDAAAEIVKYPELEIEVAAHTDSQGSAAFNQNLSQKRADSVRQYLIGKGVDASKLTSKGYGEASPIATNDTAAGRAENRRVELNVQ
ncbi:OmpA family protein [Oceanobacter kriegii]|uniref:OmpA family protein n=1 Tax=Oceanobacter kriegii TaxID=64972 RepID=UPI0004178D7A|nr:OmpA family protein [Oceanobacter kriegii]